MSGKQRSIRKKAGDATNEQEEPECQRDKLAETRLMQQLRKRAPGTGASALALGLPGPGLGPCGGGGGDGGGGGKRAGSAEPTDEPSSAAGGGPVMDTYVKAKSIATQQNEDEHMQKYIEEQLALRLGKTAAQVEEEEMDPEFKRRKVEAELYAVPADFKHDLDQEVVLPGLVSTLAEVPLSAADKLASIEATEALKRRLLAKVGAGTLVLEEEEEARVREAARIRRGQFVKQFGRAPPKQDRPPEEVEAEARKRRFISDRVSRGKGGGGRK